MRRTRVNPWPVTGWRLDFGLALDLAAVLEWDLSSGVVGLVDALARRLPRGSTAKLEAVAAGEVPPGADVEGLARAIVADAEAGRAGPAWSCWVLAGLEAALLEATGVARARVAGTRESSPRAPVVDFHAAVVARDGDGRDWLCDPFFALVLPGPGDEAVELVRRGLWACRTDLPSGLWAYRFAHGHGTFRPCYRGFAPALSPADVHSLCAVSVTHTGVAARPQASLGTHDALASAWQASDGRFRFRTWRAAPGAVWSGTDDGREAASWEEAAALFTDATGVPVR